MNASDVRLAINQRTNMIPPHHHRHQHVLPSLSAVEEVARHINRQALPVAAMAVSSIQLPPEECCLVAENSQV